jgi:hypothetical protein
MVAIACCRLCLCKRQGLAAATEQKERSMVLTDLLLWQFFMTKK